MSRSTAISTTPAPARTDTVGRVPGDDAAPAAPAPVSARLVRVAGAAVAVGATAWAGGMTAFGNNPAPGWRSTVYEVTSLLFQVGLVALVAVQRRTGAIGTGRLAKGLLSLEHVFLGLAITSTLAWMLLRGSAHEAWFVALDAFWPVSMVGMFLIGIRVAIAGRWTGAARWWPLGAESWAPVNIPIAQALPDAVQYSGAGHLMLGYVGLGVVLLLRPELTGARD
jgi:hypothetical protein